MTSPFSWPPPATTGEIRCLIRVEKTFSERGAIRLRRNKKNVLAAVRVDPDRAQAPHEQALLDGLFADGPVHKLSTSGSLTAAAGAMEESLNAQLAEYDWLRPRRR